MADNPASSATRKAPFAPPTHQENQKNGWMSPSFDSRGGRKRATLARRRARIDNHRVIGPVAREAGLFGDSMTADDPGEVQP
jgi:hypothetical protein